MGKVENKRKRAMIVRLFNEQGGLCYWCKKPMQLLPQQKQRKTFPRNMATRDHLDDKFNPDRGKHSGQVRSVVACWYCNQSRGWAAVAAQGKAAAHAASERYPR